MEIPKTLEGWELSTVEQLIRNGINENEHFDFKELPGSPPAKCSTCRKRPKKDPKARLKCVTASFANKAGGFLVIGVSDRGPLNPEERIVGTGKQEFQQEFIDGYASKCQPPIMGVSCKTFEIQGGTDWIHIVHVPKSTVGLHAVCGEDGSLRFPLRKESGGMRALTFEEVVKRIEDRHLCKSTASAFAQTCWVLAQQLSKTHLTPNNTYRSHFGSGIGSQLKNWSEHNKPRPKRDYITPLCVDISDFTRLKEKLDAVKPYIQKNLVEAEQRLRQLPRLFEKATKMLDEIREVPAMPKETTSRIPLAKWQDLCDELNREREALEAFWDEQVREFVNKTARDLRFLSGEFRLLARQ